MIQQSTITRTAQEVIQNKLHALAKTHNVRILFAIESGSRAWGFPSINSDYDVRFVYVRHLDDYLSIKEYRDVIETQIQYESKLDALEDSNGWDLRKTLYLALKSNPILFEWVQSPIRYIIHDSFDQMLMKFCTEHANVDLIKNHYYKLAVNAWNQIEEDPSHVKVKLYCYALRPALMLNWLTLFNSIPPMDMYSLVSQSIKDTALEKAICELIVAKATILEDQKMMRNALIDSFIVASLSNKPDDYTPLVISEEQLIKGNTLFRMLLKTAF